MSPQRTCIGCKAVDDQAKLQKIAIIRDGASMPYAVFDANRKLPGRGAWVHATNQCLNTAQKKGAFNRAFRARVNAERLVIEA